ncbi:hypothetical protein [Paucilactobacillus wasatchensis]|uniref:Uncharacterized protein n=1 Tax=Paucilactobacillus wasatchensis TaxID=1335616 RepID=A0A0D0Y330_9LACO|nr:hypothetical protein [Paucilactobacillus wasatchensis]KIS02658.1 hypothetical protein WDC_1774 [Paucilactobacillus wasatchensis]
MTTRQLVQQILNVIDVDYQITEGNNELDIEIELEKVDQRPGKEVKAEIEKEFAKSDLDYQVGSAELTATGKLKLTVQQ